MIAVWITFDYKATYGFRFITVVLTDSQCQGRSDQQADPKICSCFDRPLSNSRRMMAGDAKPLPVFLQGVQPVFVVGERTGNRGFQSRTAVLHVCIALKQNLLIPGKRAGKTRMNGRFARSHPRVTDPSCWSSRQSGALVVLPRNISMQNRMRSRGRRFPLQLLWGCDRLQSQ